MTKQGIIIGLYVVALPFVAIIAEWDDAPRLIIVGMEWLWSVRQW